MAEPYPPFEGPRLPLARAIAEGAGRVAGRIGGAPQALVLADASAEIAVGAFSGAAPRPGDWVSGVLRRDPGGGFRLEALTVHAACLAPPDAALAARLPALRFRARIRDAVREFFRARDFLEVETPARVVCPGLEPHLRPFRSGERWLITSPELHLKRLLAAGTERVFEMARAFRDDERGPWHGSEFTLLEWYRAFACLDAIEADCEALIVECARAAGVARVRGCELAPPFERTTVARALVERTGIDLAAHGSREALAASVAKRGHRVAEDDDWDDLFFRVWIAEVEPHLGRERPVFVHEYPASQAALARVRCAAGRPVAERFELYAGAIELANAFHELNDPAEQRARHARDREARAAAGAPVPDLDEPFLTALESGMPPASGIALGFDRLVAWLAGKDSIGAVIAFP